MNVRSILLFLVFSLLSCTERFNDLLDVDTVDVVKVNPYIQKTDSKEIKFTQRELNNLTFELKRNVNSINELGFYDFSVINDIDFEIIDIIQESNGDREFLLENIRKFTKVEQDEALFIFDLATMVMNKDFVGGGIKNEYLSSEYLLGRKRIGWRCAQAIAMSTAVTVGAIGITAGTSGAGLALGLFLISKAYSIQDIVENC